MEENTERRDAGGAEKEEKTSEFAFCPLFSASLRLCVHLLFHRCKSVPHRWQENLLINHYVPNLGHPPSYVHRSDRSADLPAAAGAGGGDPLHLQPAAVLHAG